MSENETVDVNDPCPCGSGRQYKECCLRRVAGNIAPSPEIASQYQQHVLDERDLVARFGQVRPIVQADWKGKTWVAVGDTLHASAQWKTFLDFLWDHIISVLGREWGRAEMQKDPPARHVILDWYVRTCDLQSQASQTRGPDGIYALKPNGVAAAYFNLAYDLYVLRHHQALLDGVVGRLKLRDQFQGARYELFVTATCIRAGFDIAHEDETDTSRKHPEFRATHRATGQSLWIEAKSKHRPGVLGFAGERETVEPRANVNHLLRNAAAKTPDGPYAVFVDVNVPPSEASVLDAAWCKTCLHSFCDLADGSTGASEPFNLAIFTNHPFHYGADTDAAPGFSHAAIFAQHPQHSVAHPQALVDLVGAVQSFGQIPQTFPNK
jgi:hypothetical protein